MVFKDVEDAVWLLFEKEYNNSFSLKYSLGWADFIKNKDLGIHFVKNYVDSHLIFSCTSSFKYGI